ncbi:OB-fold-containig protein [Myroides phaeus]|uniref:OB-fold-containig protein n=1 Tax=Myroides phaeus TaxID=702745 RepID=UPI0013039E34|nr:OB-fold-containig protein [Myroides phaeus]
MNELIYHLFNPLPNAIMTVLMIISIIYWIISFLGGGIDNTDIDLDLDVDINADIGVDADVDTDFDLTNNNVDTITDNNIDTTVHSDPSVFIKFLHYINVGKVPFMIVLTLLKFFTWAGTLLATTIPTVSNLGMKSVVILIPLSFIAIFVTHYATTPIARFLYNTGYHGEEAIDFIGKEGKMISSISAVKKGNVEILIENAPVKLLVTSKDGQPLSFGDKVLIINKSTDKNVYIAKKINT